MTHFAGGNLVGVCDVSFDSSIWLWLVEERSTGVAWNRSRKSDLVVESTLLRVREMRMLSAHMLDLLTLVRVRMLWSLAQNITHDGIRHFLLQSAT